MKKIITAFVVAASLGLQAQTFDKKDLDGGSEAKKSFIKNQDYLKSGVQKPGKPGPNDSLYGFDEETIKIQSLQNNIFGEEYINYLKILKRQFIYNKYKIGAQYAAKPAPQSPGKGKLGNNNVINVAPCVNEDFELTAPGQYNSSNGVQGWTITSGQNSCNQLTGEGMPTTWNQGSPEFWIVATPIIVPFIGNLTTSPLGGNVVAQLQNQQANGLCTKIAQTFPVTQANTLFQFAYAGAYQDGGHDCCNQPFLKIRMFDCNGAPLTCSSLSLNPTGNGCSQGSPGYTISSGVAWTNWSVKYIDLTPFLGSCVTIEVINSDCAPTGHWASTYFDAMCGGQLIGQGLGGVGGSVAGPVSFCAGAGQAMIAAPLGYSTYQWIGPNGPIAAPAGTMANLVINNPVLGSQYTVQLTAASGCQYISVNTLTYTQVNIVGVGTTSTCPNGSSGSATVQGNGSGTGYTYTWTNSSNSVVSTASVASSLPPGSYSVTIAGLGSSCGTSSTSVVVGVAAPSVTTLFKPFCGSEAYLNTLGGTNIQWYNGLSPIPANQGGTAAGYTVTSPQNNAVYWVSYTTLQGCKDSTKFTLTSTPPGLMSVPAPGIKLICPGASNGTANIVMVPAAGSPPGFNSFSVASTGSMAPYTASINPTSANNFTVGGLSQGIYTVVTFDGSCKYSTTFNVSAHTYTPFLAVSDFSVCPGQNVAPLVNFVNQSPSPAQYTYSWSPATWLMTGQNTRNPIFQPVVPVGTTSVAAISVVVTPTLINCPQTLALNITAFNPPIPTITAIPNLCNTFAPYQINATPGGGTFVNNTPGLIGSTSGIITPTLGTPFGTHNFTYNINVWQCGASQTGSFQVNKFNPSTLTSSVPALCVTNPAYNLMNIVQSTVNGVWTGNSNSSSAVIGGTQFNPAGLQTGMYQITYNTTSSPNPTVCPSSTPLNVSVTNTLIPSIVQVAPLCSNQGPVTMTATPAGGGWSGPNISAGGVITPTNIQQPGVSNVTYTVNVGPCLNTGYTSFSVARFNPATLTGSLQNRCFNNPPVNLMTLVQSTVNGFWNGFGVSNNVFSAASLTTGIYVLTYSTSSTPALAGCSDSRTLAVSVLNPQMPEITQVGPFCSTDAAVQLSVSPVNGNWTGSSFLSTGGVFTPSLAAVGNNAVQYIVGTNTCFAQQTKFISVEAFVPATITAKLPDLCNTGSAINLVPYTLTNLGTWMGPGIVGTNFDPSVAGKGDFILTHTTASSPSGLCPDQATVAVSVSSLAIPSIVNVGRVCNSSAPVQLNPTPVGGLFGGANNSGVDTKGLFVPASGVIGDNIINYSITAGPCVAYAQTTVTVERFISADFETIPVKFCKPDQAVNMNSYVLNPGGTWSGPGIVGNMFNPALANVGNNNLIRYETHSMPTATLCPDTSYVRINVVNIPEVSALVSSPSGCAPLEVTFNTASTNTGEGEWILGDGSEPKKGLLVSHVYNSPGTYSVVFNYSYQGCGTQAQVAAPITVFDQPKADFSFPEEVLISSPQVQFTNLSTTAGANKYSWMIPGVYESSMEVNPLVEFPKVGKYQVTLIAKNEHDCAHEITKTIEIKNDFQMHLPNIFTPNYDGLNDEFLPVFTDYGLDKKTYRFEIFDRWGRLLFSSSEPEKGWNGAIDNKGEVIKQDIYVYRIKYKDLDGYLYEKTGNVKLVK